MGKPVWKGVCGGKGLCGTGDSPISPGAARLAFVGEVIQIEQDKIEKL
jgi:hypothetical protein